MENLTEIMMAVLGGTSVLGIVQAIRYRKQTKKLKENEVKVSDVDTQRQQIDLADEYLKKVMELSEKNYQATLKNGDDNGEIIREVKEVKTTVDNIVGYLNGDFQDYLKKKNAPKPKPKPKPKKEAAK